MTPNQQLDHAKWKTDKTQTLPSSLQNVFIEDIHNYIYKLSKQIQQIIKKGQLEKVC